MWKFVTRGIRETLERRANCRTNVYSQTPQDNNAKKNEVRTSLTCNHKFIAPSFSAFTNGFCGSARNEGTKDKEYEYRWNTRRSWTEAVGWSSILALGWVVCQSMCLRRRFIEKEQKECLHGKILQLPQCRISSLFDQILNLQPKHFLPVTRCVGSSVKNITHRDIETEWQTERAFGPITVEEALKEATDEFVNTHNHVTGEYELHYGIKALDEKRYKDAKSHFSAGAKLSSPGSMFNLGLCYELGIGTLADQAKAAKHYNDAAKHDHPDAIYNLGVFYAQGRGGLAVDIDMARRYFMKAATLGQVQAKRALDMENIALHSKYTNDIIALPQIYGHTTNFTDNNSINSVFQNVNNYADSTSPHLSTQQASEKSCLKQKIPDSRTPTDIFLGLLGISESNSVPVISSPSNHSVPC